MADQDLKNQLNPLLVKRYSPRVFDARPIEPNVLQRLFEAARWSASCFNEQPWRFMVASKTHGDAFSRMLSVLTEMNQRWAKGAAALSILCANTVFSHNAKPNKWHLYDAGQAAAHLTVQAMQEGVYVHQMAGFDPQKAITEFEIPPEFVPISAIALGYPGNIEDLPEDLRARELQPRTRKPLSGMVFSRTWGSAAEFVE